MDPFRLCLALGPVAMYLLLLGAVNLSRRSLLVSGVRDAAALALAVSGLVVIGPMELFFPFESAIKLGAYVVGCLLALALYVMCVVLWLLLLRPRLVILQHLGRQVASDPGRCGRSVRRRRTLGGRQPGDSGIGRAVVYGQLRAAAQRVADFRRRQSEPRGLAAAGDEPPRGAGPRGSRPQPARPEPHRRRACCASPASFWPLPTIPRPSPARCWTSPNHCGRWLGFDFSSSAASSNTMRYAR